MSSRAKPQRYDNSERSECAENWQERVYLDMQEFREWQAMQAEEREVAALPIAS